MTNQDRILKRVQKMLNLANDSGASENERDNALRMAHATLAKYNLSLADVDDVKAEEKRQAAGEPREEHTTRFYGRPWARSICANIGDLFFCRYLYVSHKKATNVKHYFIGRHSNAITAGLIAEYVVNSIMCEGKRQQRAEGMDNAWFRAFCWGATERIRERVRQLIAGTDESQKGTGTSLVLASYYQSERQANELMVQQKYPSLSTGRGGKEYSRGEAHSRGRAYGGSVSLNTQVK